MRYPSLENSRQRLSPFTRAMKTRGEMLRRFFACDERIQGMQGHTATLLNEEATPFPRFSEVNPVLGWEKVRYGLTHFNHFCGENTVAETPLGGAGVQDAGSPSLPASTSGKEERAWTMRSDASLPARFLHWETYL